MAFGQSVPVQDDPLTNFYRKMGEFDPAFFISRELVVVTLLLEAIGSDTNLTLRLYPTLFSNEDQRKRKLKDSYTYRINDNKQVWSLTKAFPDNCYSHENATP
jgi:hypothetical protein